MNLRSAWRMQPDATLSWSPQVRKTSRCGWSRRQTMSTAVARKRRSALYLSITGLLLMVAAVTAISGRDPAGLWLRVGAAMIVAGMSMWLPPRFLIPAVLVVWLGPNAIRANLDDLELLRIETLLELPGLLLLATFSY